MSLGQGNILVQSLPLPGGGPPFPANAAENGLSVDPVTGRIVLGDDTGGVLAQLLSDREIQMDGFSFRLKQTLAGPLQSNLFVVDPTGGTYSLGDFDGFANSTVLEISDSGQYAQIRGAGIDAVNLDFLNRLYRFGDGSLSGNPVNLNIDGVANTANIAQDADKGMELDFPGRLYRFGEISGVGNSSLLSIDDITQLLQLRDLLGPMVSLDRPGQVYAFGSLDNVDNGTNLRIDDASQQVQILDNAMTGLNLDFSVRQFRMGDVFGGFNNTEVIVDDVAETVQTLGRLLTDIQTLLFQAGDTSGGGNSSIIEVDDTNQKSTYTNALHEVNGTLRITDLAGNGAGFVAVDNAGDLSFSPGASTILSTSVTLTDAQIKALPTTPIEIIPAPGAGVYILPFKAVSYGDFTAPYTNAAGGAGNTIELDMYVDDGNGFGLTMSPIDTQFAPSIELITVNAQDVSGASSSSIINKRLSVLSYNPGGDYTGGDPANFCKITVFYFLINV